MDAESPPLVVGITGASGAVYARRLLAALLDLGRSVHLAISRSGATVWQQELGYQIDLDAFDVSQLQLPCDDRHLNRLAYFELNDYMAPMASGSFLTAGMVICPCSGGTLSAVAHGASTNLIQRTADVHLKQRRPLVLVPRETPLSLIQLDNMRTACHAGAVILPAMPGWYQGVRSVDDLVDFVVARILDQLQLTHSLSRRWG